MNITSFLIVFVLFIVLPFIGLWKLFEKAGEPGLLALIPFLNWYYMIRLSGRPGWWVVWMLIPGLNILVGIGILIDFLKSYGKFSLREHAAGVLLEFIYLPKWGFDQKTQYLGPSASGNFRKKYESALTKSSAREWSEAIIFAVFAATLIRTFFIEAYVIPSGSMESTLLVGDYLFVSKVNYGARLPMTLLSFPFSQNTLPLINTKAYSDIIKLPYYRFPSLESIKKGDVVVFNYPIQSDQPYNRPVDKEDNYIKRCQGTPGDTLSIINAQVFVNGIAMPNPVHSQPSYIVHTDGTPFKQGVIDQLHIFVGNHYSQTDYEMLMTRQSAAALRAYPNIKWVTEYFEPRGVFNPEEFPHDPHLKWNVDNYGPIIIPKAGWTVKLDSLTFPVYRRAIQVYENNKLEIDGNDIVINGKKTTTYTFKQNYYWMMGDNRHNSEDSRFWGFVPEDHIVGKALFVWMSMDDSASFLNKIRWNRVFTGIK